MIKLFPPRTVKEVRSFIGMYSVYQRLILSFSRGSQAPYKLTEKFRKCEWTKECQTAFELLKELLKAAPVLTYPDMSKPYILYTDASYWCLGVCLTQVHNKDNNN